MMTNEQIELEYSRLMVLIAIALKGVDFANVKTNETYMGIPTEILNPLLSMLIREATNGHRHISDINSTQ